MNLLDIFICSFTIFLQHVLTEADSSLARGFNSDIDWMNFEDGLSAAAESKKPIMMLIHKSWCGACKALKGKFDDDSEDSKRIEELSKDFVMINIQDEEEPEGSQYSPDGGYIPRILFLDSVGQVHNELINEAGSEKYKYYYPDTNKIVKSMEKALQILGGGGKHNEL